MDAPEAIACQPLTLANLGLLLELSFGLSAWKQFGPDRWSLRCNPSSGNLHPTEAYVLCTDAALLPTGVYHYVSHDHHLQQRCHLPTEPAAAELYIGLSSIHWREAWKYGERAFRYCQHDIGHALAGLSYVAASLGWSIELLSECADADIAAWLGLDRHDEFVKEEHEAADLFCRVHTDRHIAKPFDANMLSQLLSTADWFGKAERLSGRHFYRWPIIDEVSAHALKPKTEAERWQAANIKLPAPSQNLSTGRLFRQRRSAQHFNGKAEALPLADFQRMLLALLPNSKPPYSAWNWPAQVHLFIFVHRVEGLQPGLYLLARDHQAIPELQQAFSTDFIWQAIEAPCKLYLLTPGNVRQAAKTLSCHQPIASDSAFSLGMLARFSDHIAAEAWRYRRLFW
ncbi:MAG: nitroreductase family protein, partial [Methylococcales bacterium]